MCPNGSIVIDIEIILVKVINFYDSHVYIALII